MARVTTETIRRMNKMNTDNLTIGQAREIAAMFGASHNQAVGRQAEHPFAGRFVICRCAQAGVHAGILVSQYGQEALLKNSRRLWSWTVNEGVALSGLAVHGLKAGKVDTMTDIALTDVIETIPCSEESQRSIEAA